MFQKINRFAHHESARQRIERTVALVVFVGLVLLFAGQSRADGSNIEVDAKFAINSKPISPQCLLAMTPLASGDVQATEVPIHVPNLRGCADGNFGPSTQDPKAGVSTKTLDGRQVGYRLLAQKRGKFLLRVSVSEQGSLIQWTDLWVETRSRSIRHVLPNGRVTRSVITVLVLEGLHIPKGADEPSGLLGAFNQVSK